MAWYLIQAFPRGSNVAITDEWMKFKVPGFLNAFQPQNVFNMLLNCTISYKQEKVRGGKVSKDRFTVMMAASMEGEHLPLLVIGRSNFRSCLLGCCGVASLFLGHPYIENAVALAD